MATRLVLADGLYSDIICKGEGITVETFSDAYQAEVEVKLLLNRYKKKERCTIIVEGSTYFTYCCFQEEGFKTYAIIID